MDPSTTDKFAKLTEIIENYLSSAIVYDFVIDIKGGNSILKKKLINKKIDHYDISHILTVYYKKNEKLYELYIFNVESKLVGVKFDGCNITTLIFSNTYNVDTLCEQVIERNIKECLFAFYSYWGLRTDNLINISNVHYVSVTKVNEINEFFEDINLIRSSLKYYFYE